MNREEFIKHQEEMINELFPPEHRRNVAEYAQEMLDDACKGMERLYGKDWKEKASQSLVNPNDDGMYIQVSRNGIEMRCDPKTAFLTEMAELLRKYDAVINVGWDDFDEDNCPKIDMDIVFGDGSGICFESVLNKSFTPDNIFDYKKE